MTINHEGFARIDVTNSMIKAVQAGAFDCYGLWELEEQLSEGAKGLHAFEGRISDDAIKGCRIVLATVRDELKKRGFPEKKPEDWNQ